MNFDKHIAFYNHHHNPEIAYFCDLPKIYLMPLYSQTPHSIPAPPTTDLFLCPFSFCPFQNVISGNIDDLLILFFIGVLFTCCKMYAFWYRVLQVSTKMPTVM